MMTKYARIKSYNGNLKYGLSVDTWYTIKILQKTHDSTHGRIFKIPSNDSVGFCYENDSPHLCGGSWEIAEGVELEYTLDHYFNCLTPCPNGKDKNVGSMACQECERYIKKDKFNQIVTCGYPQNKEKTMDVYEALAKAEYGDVVEADQFCRITKGRVGSLRYDNNEESVDSFLDSKKWKIVSKSRVEVTIDGEQFQISKESAKSFKESINKLKL